jgi:hypothetical protein
MRVFASLAVLIASAVVQHASAQVDYGYLLISPLLCSPVTKFDLERTMATMTAALVMILVA